MRGTVKTWMDGKGYGFIRPDEGGKDVFVHYSAINGRGFRSLDEGDVVVFGVEDTGRGSQAVDVRVVETG